MQSDHPDRLSASGTSPGDITLLLRQVSRGNRNAFRQLFPLVYDELKVLAKAKLAPHQRSQTLNPTSLVHEVYLKLVDHAQADWQSRSHFYAIASRAMRQVLIDHARAKRAVKRGAGAVHVPLFEADEMPGADFLGSGSVEDFIVLDDALTKLAAFDPRGAEVVEYHFFGGLTNREIADVLGTSEITVRRAWSAAKAWLRRELLPDDAPPEDRGGS